MVNDKFFRNASDAVDNWVNKELGKTPARFGGKPGEPVPEVDPQDLKAVWELGRMVERESPGQHVSIDLELMQHACKPGADAQAVWYRSSMLSLLNLAAPDRLSPWTKQGQLDDAVFSAAAKMPVQWMEVGVVRQGFPFDVAEFFRRLHEDQGGPA